MANKLVKNDRFKTGAHVDILYNPVWEGNTISITDSVATGTFQITATFTDDITPETFIVGDVCAFGFGAGTISAKNTNSVVVDFPNSTFPSGDISRYVGGDFQHVYMFKEGENVLTNMFVGNYVGTTEVATYGYSHAAYNTETNNILKLVPVKMVDEGQLDAVMFSKAHVLKACDTEYDIVEDNGWDADFPIELSGTSINPIYRRSYLQKRVTESKGMRAKATMSFLLIG